LSVHIIMSFNEAVRLMQEENFLEANEIYNQLVKTEPTNVAYRLWYAKSLERNLEYSEAETQLSMAIKLSDYQNKDIIHRYVNLLLCTTGELQKCTSFVQILKLNDLDKMNYDLIAIYYRGMNQPDKCQEMHKKALKLDPSSKILLFNYAVSLYYFNKHTQAIPTLLQLIQLRDDEAMYLLGIIWDFFSPYRTKTVIFYL